MLQALQSLNAVLAGNTDRILENFVHSVGSFGFAREDTVHQVVADGIGNSLCHLRCCRSLSQLSEELGRSACGGTVCEVEDCSINQHLCASDQRSLGCARVFMVLTFFYAILVSLAVLLVLGRDSLNTVVVVVLYRSAFFRFHAFYDDMLALLPGEYAQRS